MTTEYALTLCDLVARDIRHVSLALVPGEVAGVVGPAGAGKSTLLAIAAGAIALRSGAARVCGISVHDAASRRLIGYAREHPSFPSGVTVRELLLYYARLHDTVGDPYSLVREAVDLSGLGAAITVRVSRLGRADLHRLGLAQAVLGGRRVLLLDEIFSGLDAIARRDLRNRIAHIAATGVAVLLAARDPLTLERLAGRVFVLRDGRIVRAGSLAALLAERVLEVILDQPPVEPPPGFRVTASGIEAPLTGRTAEAALALCHAHRLAVRASRVRMKSLEEIVLDANDVR